MFDEFLKIKFNFLQAKVQEEAQIHTSNWLFLTLHLSGKILIVSATITPITFYNHVSITYCHVLYPCHCDSWHS